MVVVIVIMMTVHVLDSIAMVLEQSITNQAHRNVSIGCDRNSDK